MELRKQASVHPMLCFMMRFPKHKKNRAWLRMSWGVAWWSSESGRPIATMVKVQSLVNWLKSYKSYNWKVQEWAKRSLGSPMRMLQAWLVICPDSDSDERLLNLTRMFEESAIAEDISNGRSMSAGAVEEASRLIEQFLWQQAAGESLRRNPGLRAPARYRKQVQEYFRRIAEEMNTGLIGFDWPFSLSWLLVVLFLYVSLLYWHAHKLFKSTTRTEAKL